MFLAMKECTKEVEIRADALSMEAKVFTIAKESWQEKKAHLEMEVFEMKVENERIGVEGNEVLQLAFTVFEKGLYEWEEWNLEKEMLMKTLMEIKQKYAEAQEIVETMKDCMKEVEIRITTMFMELKELTRIRLLWDEDPFLEGGFGDATWKQGHPCCGGWWSSIDCTYNVWERVVNFDGIVEFGENNINEKIECDGVRVCCNAVDIVFHDKSHGPNRDSSWWGAWHN